MRGFRAEAIQHLVTIADPRIAPNGDHVLFSETTINLNENRYETGIFQAQRFHELRRITPVGSTASLARWAPDGARIACVLRDLTDDDAVARIVVIDAETLEIFDVCVPTESPSELEWSPNGKLLAYVARDPDLDYYAAPGASRKAKDTPARRIDHFFTKLDGEGWLFDRPAQIFVVDPSEHAEPERFTNGRFDCAEISWAPDNQCIAFASSRHQTWDTDLWRDIYIVNMPFERVDVLTQTDASYSHPQWSPDGKSIAALRYATPLAGPCHNHVVIIDATAASVRDLTAVLDCNATSGGSRTLVWQNATTVGFLFEDGGRVSLATVNTNNATISVIVEGPICVTEFDFRAGTIATLQTDQETLPELFINGMIVTKATPRFLAAANSETATPVAFQAVSSDGVSVDCWAMRPVGDGPFPTILNIHGGPFTQYGCKLFDEFQMQIAAGFAVVYCNPRGSSGYSEAWGRAVRWPECEIDPGTGWGGIDYDDVMACIDTAVTKFDWIDGNRLGVQGGSYGGYLTTWIVGHTDRFKAACSERSVNNLITEEHNSDVASSFAEQAGVTHLNNPDAYIRHSPITFVRNITTPMLIVHSEEDYRCPISQAEELFVALRMLGRTPEFWRFPGEGHELSRSGAPKHRIQRAQIIADFFTRYLP